MINASEKIWHNGRLIPWDEAKIHVMSHVVNYGSSVFEGVRCYKLPSGPAIFRAHEHLQRNPLRKVKGKYGEPAHWDGLASVFVALVDENPAIASTTERQWAAAFRRLWTKG